MCFLGKARPRLALGVLALFLASCNASRSEQYRIEGDAYWKQGAAPQAAESYRMSLTLNAGNSLAFVGIGHCLMAQQKLDEALANFLKAIDAAPALELPYVEAVNVLLAKNQGEKAIDSARNLEAVSPVRGAMLRAFVLGNTDRLGEAVELLTELRDRFPKSANVRIALAKALLAAKKADEAEVELRAVLTALDASSLEARMTLVDACGQQNKIGPLAEEYRQLVERTPEDVGLRLVWARTLFYGGKIDQANAIAEEILKQDRTSGWANYIVGCCLLARRQQSEAIPFLQAAVPARLTKPLWCRLLMRRALRRLLTNLLRQIPGPSRVRHCPRPYTAMPPGNPSRNIFAAKSTPTGSRKPALQAPAT